MQPRCSCGAVLPEDARFCHKCGKPQYEEDIARLTPEPIPETLPRIQVAASSAPKRGRSGFRAVAVSMVMAAAALLASSILARLSPYLVFIVLLAAGFFAAVVYKRQSSRPLSMQAGAFVGWLTGLWLFVVVGMAAISPAGAQVLQQMKSMPQFSEVLSQNPREVFISMAFTSFFVFTILPGLGGILGATLSTRGQRSS